MSHFSQAIDEVRAAEARKLAAEGRAPVLKHSRSLRSSVRRISPTGRRNGLAGAPQPRTVRAYLLKRHFHGCGATCRRTGRGGISTAVNSDDARGRR